MKVRTGDCYRKAYRLLMGRMSEPWSDGWMLCHGVVIGTGEINKGKPCGHAWLENMAGTMVFDPAGRYVMKRTFYEVGRVSYVHRYTVEEALTKAAKHGVYGPWDQMITDAEKWIEEE